MKYCSFERLVKHRPFGIFAPRLMAEFTMATLGGTGRPKTFRRSREEVERFIEQIGDLAVVDLRRSAHKGQRDRRYSAYLNAKRAFTPR